MVMNNTRGLLIGGSFAFALLIASPGWIMGANPMQSRVPAAQLKEAKSLRNPISPSPETVEAGKALYKGKGTCHNCHGETGNGQGPAAAVLKPPPRNFREPDFWKHRTEGEIFWVIKHGSPGTAMIPFGGMLSDQEIWKIIQFVKTFSP